MRFPSSMRRSCPRSILRRRPQDQAKRARIHHPPGAGLASRYRLCPGPDRSPQAQHILAAGGARLNVHTIYAKTPPEDTTVQGDQLFATLADGEVLSSLRGTGHTSLVSVSPSGVTQSSKGDNLLLTFAPPHPLEDRGPGDQRTALRPHAAAGRPAAVCRAAGKRDFGPARRRGSWRGRLRPATTATAQRAAYDAATQVVQLSGNPRIQETSGELSATLIEMERTTGNANATGGVKATYRQANGQQNMAFAGTRAGACGGRSRTSGSRNGSDHLLTERPASRLACGREAIPFPRRCWSSPGRTRLFPRMVRAASAAAVNAVFTSSPAHSTVNTKTPAGPSVVRLQSRTLFYAENDHKAVFSGAVVAQTSTGLVHSSFMDVYFSPAPAAQPPAKTPQTARPKVSPNASLEDRRPGRRGTPTAGPQGDR